MKDKYNKNNGIGTGNSEAPEHNATRMNEQISDASSSDGCKETACGMIWIVLGGLDLRVLQD